MDFATLLITAGAIGGGLSFAFVLSASSFAAAFVRHGERDATDVTALVLLAEKCLSGQELSRTEWANTHWHACDPYLQKLLKLTWFKLGICCDRNELFANDPVAAKRAMDELRLHLEQIRAVSNVQSEQP